MRITLLGTGDAGGTPRYGCTCPACRTIVRRPTQALVETDSGTLLIDTGTAFPEQRPDAVLLTHFHFDHVAGLVPLRWGIGDPLPVYAPEDERALEFLFRTRGILDFHHPTTRFPLAGLRVTPVPLQHSVPTYGWILQDNAGCVAYLTDTKGLPAASRARLRATDIDLLVLDCTHPPREDPGHHNDLDRALHLVKGLGAARTLLVHIGHELDCARLEGRVSLPENVEFTHDGHALAVVQGK
ncbi:MAG: MBL fold metallo-hydrolase [Planctomycetota bacterium]|jgi:phosphoribosyl 1,2-cyclic phosphate phosphodiesterase